MLCILCKSLNGICIRTYNRISFFFLFLHKIQNNLISASHLSFNLMLCSVSLQFFFIIQCVCFSISLFSFVSIINFSLFCVCFSFAFFFFFLLWMRPLPMRTSGALHKFKCTGKKTYTHTHTQNGIIVLVFLVFGFEHFVCCYFASLSSCNCCCSVFFHSQQNE